MRLMADELMAGRAPANIMVPLAGSPKLGNGEQLTRMRPNDPCLCGSGNVSLWQRQKDQKMLRP